MMKLLTTMTQIYASDLTALDECISYGGLVDRETASAADVALWSDGEITAALERAASARRNGRHAA